jgi:anti-sigma factor ChrR (cupin superfamily)
LTKDVAMELRADFARREVVRPGGEAWWLSPTAATERYVLDRIGEEVARETVIVRYAAGSRLSAHTHGGGEEFLVLAGSFHDDAGDYPDGTYVRNPIGTAHAPWAGPDGAVLFLKLHQFTAADSRRVVIDTRAAHWRQGLVKA